MSTECQGKSSWPELLGVPGATAVETIERENPLVTAIIVPPGTSVTTDFRCDRVWVYVDDNGNVDRVPRIGKSSWPELLGVSGATAVTTIERENPLVNAIIVPPGSSIILDVRCDRVWVFVDNNGNVDRVPRIG
ncbi:unnamed protein product [Fraxinus pennsylvanica]|uniref:Uncharacterized protein n=1 Tax=Fraxinus pennsylvanica TaxID=56036 RepID=A0AAD2DRP6_9LAMI|nr:unnamed protein product [Fraxinus pennsylvanica]